MWLFLCKTFSCINCCRKICRGYFWIVSYTLFCVNSCRNIFHFLTQRIFLQEFLCGFLQVFVQVFMCRNLCTFSGRKIFWVFPQRIFLQDFLHEYLQDFVHAKIVQFFLHIFLHFLWRNLCTFFASMIYESYSVFSNHSF